MVDDMSPKGKLNLNELSSKIIAVIGLFLVVIPVVLSVSALLLSAPTGILESLRNGSLVVGLILGAGFLVLVIVEQIQDHAMDAAYRRNRDRKVPLPGGGYECQYCGSQRIRARDTCCPVCGRALR